MENTSSINSPSTALHDIEQRAKIFAALSEPTRLRIVELLAEGGELSGSEIAGRLEISLALFCHHSKTLAEAGVIQVRREGQTRYNSLNRELLSKCFASFRLC
jgi:DNA-binding transcriptional ArsR family regulator